MTDAIDLHAATIIASPSDIADWPVTTTITQLIMDPAKGLSFTLVPDTWPDYTPLNWTGPIEYTVWATFRWSEERYAAGFIQMWRGRDGTGAPLLADGARNWWNDLRGLWGPMQGYVPQVGDSVGFFVSAGNARLTGGVTSVRERSNVVLVRLPKDDTGVFVFGTDPAPSPVPVPPAPPDPDLRTLLSAVEMLQDDVHRLQLRVIELAGRTPPSYQGSVLGVKVVLRPV